MENLIFTNAYRIITNDTETQLLLRVETPIIDEKNNVISGTSVTDVADVRMSTTMAKQLYLSLKENFEDKEKAKA